MRTLTKYLLTLAAFFVPGLSHATQIPLANGDEWTIYVFMNGREIAELFVGAKGFVQDPGYASLILFLATASVIAYAVRAGFNMSKHGPGFLVWIMTVGLVGNLGISYTSDVIIHDEQAECAGLFADRVVTDAPSMVVIPAAVISTIGRFLRQGITEHLGSTDASALSRCHVFAPQVFEDTKRIMTPPRIGQNLANFGSDCIVPAIATGRVSVESISGSKDIWSMLVPGEFNSGVMTNQVVPVTDPVTLAVTNTSVLSSCAQAYAQLTTELGTFADAAATSRLFEFTADQISLMANNMGGTSGSSHLRQMVVMNWLEHVNEDAAALTGTNEMTYNSQSEIASRQVVAQNHGTFENFLKNAPYAYSTIQAMIYLTAPLAFVMLMVPGMGGQAIKNYVYLLIWISMWAPMFAIIYSLINAYYFYETNGAMTANCGGAGAAGPCMNSMSILSMKSVKLLATAEALIAMTPVFSWVLVKVLDLSTHVNNLAGVGSATSTMASGVATGNVNAGVQNYNNSTYDKMSMTREFSVGTGAVQAVNGSGAIHDKQMYSGTEYVTPGWSGKQSNNATSGSALADMNKFNQSATENLKLAEVHSKSIDGKAAFGADVGFTLSHGGAKGEKYDDVVAKSTQVAKDMTNLFERSNALSSGDENVVKKAAQDTWAGALRIAGGDAARAATNIMALAQQATKGGGNASRNAAALVNALPGGKALAAAGINAIGGAISGVAEAKASTATEAARKFGEAAQKQWKTSETGKTTDSNSIDNRVTTSVGVDRKWDEKTAAALQNTITNTYADVASLTTERASAIAAARELTVQAQAAEQRAVTENTDLSPEAFKAARAKMDIEREEMEKNRKAVILAADPEGHTDVTGAPAAIRTAGAGLVAEVKDGQETVVNSVEHTLSSVPKNVDNNNDAAHKRVGDEKRKLDGEFKTAKVNMLTDYKDNSRAIASRYGELNMNAHKSPDAIHNSAYDANKVKAEQAMVIAGTAGLAGTLMDYASVLERIPGSNPQGGGNPPNGGTRTPGGTQSPQPAGNNGGGLHQGSRRHLGADALLLGGAGLVFGSAANASPDAGAPGQGAALADGLRTGAMIGSLALPVVGQVAVGGALAVDAALQHYAGWSPINAAADTAVSFMSDNSHNPLPQGATNAVNRALPR